jgi:urease gamma subunit
MIGRRLVAGTALVAAVAAGGVAGALIGVPGMSGAATSPSSTTTEQGDAPHVRGFGGHVFIGAGKGVLDAGAKALNLTTDDLLAKLRDGKTTIADVAKEQNVDVQTVIDAMAAAAKSDITDMVNNPLPVPPSFPDGSKGPGFFGHGLRENKLDAAAKALGITADELLTQLRDGKSIADVAKTKNVDVNKVIDAMVSDAESKIEGAVKDGDLTPDEATKIKSDLKDRITELVNNAPPSGERPFGGGGFGPGRWAPDTQQG